MTDEEIIKLCKERNELTFLFQIAKHIAETDSIGEGYTYCPNYDDKFFNNGDMHTVSDEHKAMGFKDGYDEYLKYGAIPIYKIYLKQIGVLQ